MSKRRNFLALMAGTASLGVLSSVTTGIFKPQPSYAGVEQCGTITNDAGKIAEEAIKAAGALGQLALRMSGGIKSASASESETFGESVARSKAASAAEFQSLVKTFDESVDRDIEFWSKPDSLTSFVMSASVNEHNKSIQSMKGKFSSQQISAALSKAIKNLEANNIAAIESDPIIGPAAKAGYAAASSKLKQLANLRRQYSTNLKDIPAKVSARVETEAVSLRRQGKLTNQQIQKFSSSYPSLAPAFRKALDLPAKPGLPGAVPGQLKSDPKLLNQLPFNVSDPISGISTDGSRNKFDDYAQLFDLRLTAVNMPVAIESDFSIVDSLLGIQPAQAVIGGILLGAALFALLVLIAAAIAENLKNAAVKACILRYEQPGAVAACERRADQVRKDAKRTARADRAQCKADSFFDFLCDLAYTRDIAAIEIKHTFSINACS